MQDTDLSTINKRSARGVLALISRAFFLNILSYIASLIIFSYLKPLEVGIYIAVTAIQRIISFITDFGLGAALIQKKDQLKKEDLTTTFTIQAGISFLVFILVIFSRDIIAKYFNLNEAAVRLLLVLVFTVFISSFKVIPSILLEREIKFHKLIVPQIIESLVYNVLLIFLIVKGLGIDSYSVAFFVSSISSIPFYYLVSPWKISVGVDKESLKHLHYGIQFQGKNILATIKDDFLTIFLAKVLTFSQLGYIGFGQRNAFFFYRYIVDSVVKVTFSTYSRIQDNKELLQKTIEKSLFYVSLAMFPMLLGVIIMAPYVIRFFPKWSNKWEPALFSLTFFSLNALVSSVSGILVNVLDATGRVKTTLKLMILWTTLTWVLTPLLIYVYGYNGVAIASFLVTGSIFVTIHLVKKIVDFNIFKSMYKPVISTVVMSAIVYLSAILFVKDVITLFAVILIGVGAYALCIYIMARREIQEAFKLVFQKV